MFFKQSIRIKLINAFSIQYLVKIEVLTDIGLPWRYIKFNSIFSIQYLVKIKVLTDIGLPWRYIKIL